MRFKTCTKCNKQWETKQEFLADNSLKLNGYQISVENLDSGLILFTHLGNDCNSTIAIHVYEFDDIYSGERYSEVRAQSEDCPRYCFDEKRLDRCDVKCECAFVREIINHIKSYPKCEV